MIKYDSVVITPVSGAETMAAAAVVTGAQGKNKKVLGIYTEPTTSIRVVAYKDQDFVADIDSEAFDGGGFMPLDCSLGPGETFKVGLWSTSGTTAQDVSVKWEETG